jgi:hypothetical protein
MTNEARMTTIRQLIHASPAKANELFARLLETSSNAVKTRAKLFSELKAELQTLAELEEEHLFPVLRKHKATKELAAEALKDNKQTRALLARIEQGPMDGEDFAASIAELRKVFQQHVRDERKELLPAVLKALSDEEAQAIVDNIEDKKAEIEDAKRAEAEQRRAEARLEREQALSAEEATESIAEAVRAGTQGAEHAVRTARDMLRTGLGAASETALRSTGQLARVFGFSEEAQDLAARSSHNLQAVAQTGTALARGLQDLSREWLEMTQARLQKNISGFGALARCRSVQDLVAVQTGLVRDNLEEMIDGGRRIAELSMRIVDDAAQTIAAEPEREAPRVKRAA